MSPLIARFPSDTYKYNLTLEHQISLGDTLLNDGYRNYLELPKKL